jgi:para-nitrobenzyl esterase
MIFGVQNYTWANIADKTGKKSVCISLYAQSACNGEYVKYGAFHTGKYLMPMII